MQIDILASSSSGNCYMVRDRDSRIMIECGFPIREIQKQGGFNLHEIQACLVSHGH